MPTKKKGELDEAEIVEGKKPRSPEVCARCVLDGIPEKQVTFPRHTDFMLHARSHAAKDREAVKAGLHKAKPRSEAAKRPSKPAEEEFVEPQPKEPDVEPVGELDLEALEVPLDEAKVLRRVLKDAGVTARVDAITRHFMNHSNLDDLPFLDSLVRAAGCSVPVIKWVLLGWADHRQGGQDWVNAKYPEQALTFETPEKAAEKKAAEPKQEESPFKAMMSMLKEQQEMEMSMQILQTMRDKHAQGAQMGTDGRYIETKKEDESKLRSLDDGSFVKMTDSEWTEYVLRKQHQQFQEKRLEQETKLKLAADEKKKESEKIPLRLDDGQIVNVPADQVDKYLFLMKSMAPDQKKDVYELMREQERTRQEMQTAYQQQMQQLKDQMNQMLLERQEHAINQLRTQMANRPNPIMEMVQTQEELRQAGLMKQEGESIDQHKMVLQEKKLDTTMNLMIQQQASLNRKTDQLLGVLGPIAQKFAQEAAEDLPRPKELRQKGLARRKQLAQEIMPVSEQQMEQMQEQLEQASPPEEVPEQEPRRKKALTVGRTQ